MNTIKKLLTKIIQLPIVYNLYRYKENLKKQKRNRSTMDLLYKIEDLNIDYYNAIKNSGEIELEHQIGRLTNFKGIIKACKSIDGDFIEFGTWKGFSLLWIAYFLERYAVFNRKLVGLDGFIGLPYADGVFKKEAFNDATLKMCRNNILNNKNLYNETKKNILIAKYLYKEKEEIIKYLETNNLKKFCFIHIDCDVSQSAEEIFKVLLEGNFIADKSFILFDDYGWTTNLAKSVDSFLKKTSKTWIVHEHSCTKYTKNFFLEKRK